jgi:hypothetical protein
MTTPILDLQGIKTLYKVGMDYARNNYSSVFYTKQNDLCDYQLKLVDQATDLTTLMNAVSIPNRTWSTCFNAPKNLCCGCELSKTGIQFGVGTIEWYFFYGTAENYVFNLSFFKQEIAPPQVVTIDPSEAVRWNIVGGYGTINPPAWYAINSEYIYMKYTQPTYSTFSLQGSGNNINATLSSPNPMQFACNLQFNDSTNTQRTFSFVLNANTQPSPAFPKSCLCGLGLGTMYYSYTDMNVNFIADGKTSTGKGWLDHQLIKNGTVTGWYNQSLETVSNIFNKKKSPGWLWTSIQDNETGLQYMLVYFFNKKYYQDSISLNDDIQVTILNEYNKGVTNFSPEYISDFSMQMTETVNIPSMNINLPSSYKITLPGGKKVILKTVASPNVYTNVNASYECPSALFDSTGTKQIGTGLIEANVYFTNEVYAQRMIKFAGGDTTDQTSLNIVLDSLENKQTTWQKFLAIITALIPVWLIITLIFFVFYKKKDMLIKTVISIGLYLVLMKLVKNT